MSDHESFELSRLLDEWGSKHGFPPMFTPEEWKENATPETYEHPEFAQEPGWVRRSDGKPGPTEKEHRRAGRFLRHEFDITQSVLIRTNYLAGLLAEIRAETIEYCAHQCEAERNEYNIEAEDFREAAQECADRLRKRPFRG